MGTLTVLSGCHDTTLAAVLASLGAFEGEPWPPYTSHIAIEMFRKTGATKPSTQTFAPKSSWWDIFPFSRKSGSTNGIARQKIEQLPESEKAKLDGHYVRLRYNDKVMTVPGCKPNGKHLDGDESFCTLAAFKEIVDKFVPSNWKQACVSNLEAPAFPSKPEPAGY